MPPPLADSLTWNVFRGKVAVVMRTLLTRRAGQPGTKKLMLQYGADLVCVRYRYDDELQQRMKTVEIVVDRVGWHRKGRSNNDSAIVRVRIAANEDLLRRAALFAGGRWEESTDTWKLQRRAAVALGLTTRIMRFRGKVADDQQ